MTYVLTAIGFFCLGFAVGYAPATTLHRFKSVLRKAGFLKDKN